jgi:hypothetical protein
MNFRPSLGQFSSRENKGFSDGRFDERIGDLMTGLALAEATGSSASQQGPICIE